MIVQKQFASAHMHETNANGFTEKPYVWAKELAERLDGTSSSVPPVSLIELLTRTEKLTTDFIRGVLSEVSPDMVKRFDACLDGMNVRPQ